MVLQNFPGFPEGIQGPELIQMMKQQAARFGTEFIAGDVTAANLGSRPLTLTEVSGPPATMAGLSSDIRSPSTSGMRH